MACASHYEKAFHYLTICRIFKMPGSVLKYPMSRWISVTLAPGVGSVLRVIEVDGGGGGPIWWCGGPPEMTLPAGGG